MANFGRSAKGKFNSDNSFYSLFHGERTILLEDELNEFQWSQIEKLASMINRQYTSGLIGDFQIKTTGIDDIFYIDSTTQLSAVFEGYDLKIGNNSVIDHPVSVVPENNRVVFKLPHVNTGSDLVFLEAWFEVMGPNDKIKQFGGEATPLLPNKMFDMRIGKETARRVQFRWRIRSARNVSVLTDVTAQNYDGANTTHNFAVLDGIYAAELGEQKDIDNNIKTLGKVYAIPLFNVTRNNSYTINSSQIENVSIGSKLRLLGQMEDTFLKIFNGTVTESEIKNLFKN